MHKTSLRVLADKSRLSRSFRSFITGEAARVHMSQRAAMGTPRSLPLVVVCVSD